MAKETNIHWIKCPSVTHGGKPHFWYYRDSHEVRWHVIWNRTNLSWSVTKDEKLHVLVASEDAGKKYVQKIVSKY